MKVISAVSELQSWSRRCRSRGRKVGLVPTMGALHKGHESLIRKAAGECDAAAVSVFVNPSQFGPGEDYDSYPRNFQRDCRVSEESGAEVVFHPCRQEMYPGGPANTDVNVAGITGRLCGRSRPGHFRGVATVVAKLFNAALPDRAYFGRKDYQQLLVIRKMTEDLNFPVEVVGCPTVREADGLAVSSRNDYLEPEERSRAVHIYRGLKMAEDLLIENSAVPGEVSRKLKQYLEEKMAGSRVDYAGVYDCLTLEPAGESSGCLLIAAAVKLGSARLIDNIMVRGS